MKSVLFSEEEINNPQVIAEKVFNDENDPRSVSYVRKLNRPKINGKRIIVCLLAPLLLSVILFFTLRKMGLNALVALSSVLVGLLIYLVIIIKPAIICCVRIYQKYAPERIRNKCRFEPSCSEYMIIVIEKHGLIKGIKKGIQRLKRCNINGGGFDYPT